MSFMGDFKEFLEKYNVAAMAVAFIMGLAAKDLINSLVNNMVMPLIDVVQPEGGWRNITVTVGPANFGVGLFLGSLVDFAIIALVIFFMIKLLTDAGKKMKKVQKNLKKEVGTKTLFMSEAEKQKSKK
jgi:large conductance mechanosensitive channel